MEAIKRDRSKLVEEILKEIEAGRNPIEYLKGLGYGNPSQAYSDIRKMMKKQMPEKFALLPEDLRAWNRQHIIETPEDSTVIPRQKPKKTIIHEEADKDDDIELLAVRSKKTGNKYEWRAEFDLFSITAHGDELALCLSDLKDMLNELPTMAERLGVKL